MEKVGRSHQAELRKRFNLPYRCECGGLMHYSYEFQRVWSHCRRCTPVDTINMKTLRQTREARSGPSKQTEDSWS